MRSEVNRIIDQLQRAFDGDAWSGPSLQATLAGLTPAQAGAHPLAGAHSIGELVLHLATWAATVARRLEQRADTPLTSEDWPAFPTQPDEPTWQQALEQLHQAHEHLLGVAGLLTDADLGQTLGQTRERPEGTGVSLYVLLHGTAQHYLYHAGQVALLRKSL